METKIHYILTNGNITLGEYDLISQAKTEDDFKELVEKGLAYCYIEDAETIFTKELEPLSKWEKIKLLVKLLFKY